MSRKPESRAMMPCLPPEEASAIRAQLERILGSSQFRGSRRCQNLLRHITEQTLVCDTARLKERSIGIEVFERPPDYDTGQDPVVRATAAEIRKKLAQYYQEPAHTHEPRIELLPGSYIAELHVNGHAPQDSPAPSPAPTPPPAPEPVSERRLWVRIGLSAAVAVALIAVLTLMAPRWRETELEQLWRPVIKAPGMVLLSIGQPITYNLRSIQAQDAIQGVLGMPPAAQEGPDYILKKDLVILADRYAALGDVVCLVRVTSLLDRSSKPYRIRGERSTTFADLRETPAVLIGAFDNQWTMHIAGQLRYTFVKDDEHATDFVRDQQHPDNRQWKVTGAWPSWDVSTDYAIVTRVLSTTTDRPLVIAAGITHYGTMAAGEFLTNPEYFGEAVPRLPRGWQNKNVQFVLRIPVVNRVPSHPQVLAVHVW